MNKLPLYGVIVLSLAVSCARMQRSKYQPYSKKSGGYSDLKSFDPDDWSAVEFYGNGYTHHNDVLVFTQLRAVDVCMNQGKLPLISTDIEVTSDQLQVTNTSSSSYTAPTTVEGNATTSYNSFNNTLDTNYSGQVNHGASFGGSQSVSQTLKRFNVKLYYKCHKRVYGLGIKRPVPNVMDVARAGGRIKNNGIKVGKVSRLNRDVLFQGDLIVKVNNSRVFNDRQLADEIMYAKGKPVKLTVIRDGKKKVIKVKTKDTSSRAKSAYFAFINEKCRLISEFSDNPLCNSGNRKPASTSGF